MLMEFLASLGNHPPSAVTRHSHSTPERRSVHERPTIPPPIVRGDRKGTQWPVVLLRQTPMRQQSMGMGPE
jgi:hypothetical protein